MSEIKFACPHCSQHIACDDAYCGERINCPGCSRALLIPPRTAFIPLPAGNLNVIPPVALREQPYPRPPRPEVWTEEGWEQHATALGAKQPPRLLPFWVLLLLPFVIDFILLTHRTGIAVLGYIFILCALASGFYLAKIHNNSGAALILVGLVYALGMLCVYAALSFGLLFVGCLVAVM